MSLVGIFAIIKIWRMSVSETSPDVETCSVSNSNSDVDTLLFGIREHWLAKKS